VTGCAGATTTPGQFGVGVQNRAGVAVRGSHPPVELFRGK
jgi:hypothetical protein